MLIPALDLIEGQVVRLKQGDFEQKTVFDLDPIARIQDYSDDGAELIHIVDLDGAKNPDHRQIYLIEDIVKASRSAIQVGGGVRTREDITQLIDLGVARVVLGSVAVNDPDFAVDAIKSFGADKICIALDVRIINDVPLVATHGWLETSQTSIFDLLDDFTKVGLEHVLVTDISRDGMMSGANVELYSELYNRYGRYGLDVIASGGISNLDDLESVKDSGATSCIIGGALLNGAFTLHDALDIWPN